MQTRDIIVIGASMGGIEALSALARQLPRGFPATVLAVQHAGEASPGLLAEILGRQGALPAVTAEDGMALQRGHIVVAPPDRHLLLDDDGIRVVFGPRENRSRPSIDALRLEARLTLQAAAADAWNELPGTASNLTCAECRGALREIDDEGWRRYRCRVGHAFSTVDLLDGNAASLEQSLWVALQTLQERANVLEHLASNDPARGGARYASDYRQRAREMRDHGERLRRLLMELAEQTVRSE
ncbi:MAG: chemotaxis protein CheB [Pseudomonadales bacterium]